MHLNTSRHPQTNCKTERVNHILEDLLQACILDFGGSWDDRLHLVEFSYKTVISMAPFKALYGRPCNAPFYWWEAGKKPMLKPNMIRETLENIKIIQQWMKEAQDKQKLIRDVEI